MNQITTLKELKKHVANLDQKRKNDLLDNLVNDVFDPFFDSDSDFRIEAMIENIENITGLQFLNELCIFELGI